MVRTDDRGGTGHTTTTTTTSVVDNILSVIDAYGNPITRSTELVVLNPPFDPRMRRIGSPAVNPKPLQRGWIQTSPEDSNNWRVNFLFNPSSITLSSAMDPNVPNMKQVSANKNLNPASPALLGSMGTSLSFSLLFDRTYEMWSQDRSQENVAKNFGVYADVGAFYKYLHMIPDLPTRSPGHISLPGEPIPELSALSAWNIAAIQSPPIMIASYLYIGAKMRFYGWISSINVEYTHWSHEMVPIRCRVDIGFTVALAPETIPFIKGYFEQADIVIGKAIRAVPDYQESSYKPPPPSGHK